MGTERTSPNPAVQNNGRCKPSHDLAGLSGRLSAGGFRRQARPGQGTHVRGARLAPGAGGWASHVGPLYRLPESPQDVMTAPPPPAVSDSGEGREEGTVSLAPAITATMFCHHVPLTSAESVSRTPVQGGGDLGSTFRRERFRRIEHMISHCVTLGQCIQNVCAPVSASAAWTYWHPPYRPVVTIK